jgi:hypothetical protein
MPACFYGKQTEISMNFQMFMILHIKNA